MRPIQRLNDQERLLSAREAQRVANRAVFGDLVGAALQVEAPVWAPAPTPHWRIPYRHWDGTLLIIIEVDAQTSKTNLTADARAKLLDALQMRSTTDASSFPS